ncbi:MAG: hypothetical protein H8E41_11490 [Desulfobulbaceae bacterium]|uniref:DUF3795 domain-containing protein n=1 Tax=Candidatus Desulfobia pelagia TaxID=2841692 RepID=A0A8J6NDH9_9BACT|nr:hypothetical protein [Candidatus Desulfobia pelagia]
MRNEEILESALEKAAKVVCNLKCGLCPIHEDGFSGCPYDCREEILPWQCWAAHFKQIGESKGRTHEHGT